MPITLNHSNIGVQYSTGSNYIIETVKSDLYLRDTRTDITSNLLAEPTVISPTMTESIRSFIHNGGTETQTTHTITVGQDTICDVLVVGGGGCGGRSGGGGGAVIYTQNVLFPTGTYSIKVGNGGISIKSGNIASTQGANGYDSEILFNTTTIFRAKGGGFGGPNTTAAGGTGGSGGGSESVANNSAVSNANIISTNTLSSSFTTLTNQSPNGSTIRGNIGGKGTVHSSYYYYLGGGGGGAGSAGGNGNTTNATSGSGGDGVNIDITGSLVMYGSGGAGGIYNDYSFGANNITAISGSVSSGGGTGAYASRTQSVFGSFPTAGQGGGGGGWSVNALTNQQIYPRDGGSGIVIIKFKSTTAIPEGNPITHKRLNFAYDLTKNAEYQAQLKTGVGGWRIVRYLPPNTGRWYQGNYITTSTFTIPTIGTQYNYTNEWAVPFGTFDEMFFATFDMTYWLQCLKTSVLGDYSNELRPVIKSSERNYAYSVRWFNRAVTTVNLEDPWISINDHSSNPPLMLYGENSNTANFQTLLNTNGGMCVLVRDSTASTTILNPNTYTLNFPVLTIADINNNSNIVLRGAYDISLSTMNSSIIPKSGQYIPKLLPLTTSNISLRYNLLNPTLDPVGAQWTYNSSNTNVYHMGSVGIGTKSPEYDLDVRGTIYSSLGGYTSSALTKWAVLSDRRIKENIVKASYDKCLENVKNIELYNFNFKDNCVNTNDRHQLGFIAQEVQQIYPKAVEVGKMILNLEEKIDDLLTLNITQIDYTLYGAVKSLIEKMENIKIKMEQIKTAYDIP